MKKGALISLLAITALGLMTSNGHAAASSSSGYTPDSGNSIGTSQAIVFSDVHFNPFYDTTIFQSLVAADASQWGSIFASSGVSEPSSWGKDSNYPLFALALSSLRANSALSSVAIFPGDILVHNFGAQFYALYGSEDEEAMKSFLYKTVTFFASEVRAYLGNMPVMFEIGNNDAYEGDFKIEPNSQFLADTAEPFYTLFLNSAAGHDAFLNTYKAGGYYSAQPLGTNLVVIGLNSIFFSPDAASDTKAAAAAELDWFESTLASAAHSGQKAWLLTHIPPGANIHSNKDRIDARGHLDDAKMMWDPDIQARFLNILSAYSNTVTMIFTGHTHMDEYRLPACALEVTPAISPVDGNNPAFKVFTYYTGSFEITDYSAINYDLATMPDSFKEYYTFSSAYETCGILGTMLESVFPTLRSSSARKAAYQGHYYSGHDSASPINDTNWPVYWCGIGKMLKQDYIDCVNGFAHKQNDYDGDRKSDLAVFRNGYWSIYLMAGSVLCDNTPLWVGPGYIPVPGDYDGDGKSDLAVFRDGYWSIYLMAGSVLCDNAPLWVGPGYIPVPGDYDGDGKSDLAVFRDGYWSIYLMAGSILCDNAPLWVGPGYIPVPGDYDGDGKSDLAVYRDGYWSIYSLASGIILNNEGTLGGTGWTPVR